MKHVTLEDIAVDPTPSRTTSKLDVKFDKPNRRSFTVFVKDTGIVSCERQQAEEIEEAENFINSLPDVSYDVIKIFPWGKRERVLKLSSAGIENIKNGVPSSIHTYQSITCVAMRDLEVFVISYEGDHDYVYKSEVAMQIVQEISCRLEIRRTTEKKKFNYDFALQYQKKLAEDQNQTEGSEELEVVVDDKEFNSFVSPSYAQHSIRVESKSKKAHKLLNLLGSTEQQRIGIAIEQIALDPDTVEGKHVAGFVKKWNLGKNPMTAAANTRSFIEGVKQYIVDTREEQLSKLLIEASQSSFRPDDLSLDKVLERSLQSLVIVPLYKQITYCISHTTGKIDQILREKKAMMKGLSQEQLGVKEHCVAPDNYISSVQEINFLDKTQIPADKAAILMATARTIYNSVNYRHRKKGQKGGYFLSADDFLPIFIFVVVNSDLDNLETTSEFMWTLCDPGSLKGEIGYYLTVFQSALHWIKHFDMSKVVSAHG